MSSKGFSNTSFVEDDRPTETVVSDTTSTTTTAGQGTATSTATATTATTSSRSSTSTTTPNTLDGLSKKTPKNRAAKEEARAAAVSSNNASSYSCSSAIPATKHTPVNPTITNDNGLSETTPQNRARATQGGYNGVAQTQPRPINTTGNNRGQAKLTKLALHTGRAHPSMQQQQQQQQQQILEEETALNRGQAKLAKLDSILGRDSQSRSRQEQSSGDDGMNHRSTNAVTQPETDEETALPRGQVKLGKLDNMLCRNSRSRSRQEQSCCDDGVNHRSANTGIQPYVEEETALPRGQVKLAKLDNMLCRNSRSRSRQERSIGDDGMNHRSIGNARTQRDVEEGTALPRASNDDEEQQATALFRGSSDDGEQQATPGEETLSFLPSLLDASRSSQNEPIEEATLSSSGQLQVDQAAPNRLPPTLQRGDTGLAVARAIDDGSSVLMEAQEVDAETLERKAIERKKNRKCVIVGLVLTVASLTVLLGTIVGRSTTTKNNIELPQDQLVAAPSMAPSGPPSSAPSGALDVLRGDLPEYSLESLDTFDTPQWKAWDWLMNHKNISNLEEWRKKQLFALATFFYSFEGENWNYFIRERWMDYEKEECQWFSSGFGMFLFGEYRELPSSGQTPPCNDDGEFKTLELQDLQLSGLTPSMPPEIALLTSLSTVSLVWNDINASLSEMLPSELGRMTNLTAVKFGINTLRGTIPSELGLITSLASLELVENALTGSLPSELGLVTSLTFLSLDYNSLTGQLPSELSMMTSLTKVDLSWNALTGQLPSQLGLMTSLEWLFLYENALTGQLPSELALMTNLTWLRLEENALTGRLPSELGMMTSLTWLNYLKMI